VGNGARAGANRQEQFARVTDLGWRRLSAKSTDCRVSGDLARSAICLGQTLEVRRFAQVRQVDPRWIRRIGGP
jgi:hypothetical protein